MVGCAGAVVAPLVSFAGHLIGKQIPVYDVSCRVIYVAPLIICSYCSILDPGSIS